LVKAWNPRAGHKPAFLDNFPPAFRPRVLNKIASILERFTPSLAAHDRRDDDIVKAVGASMPKLVSTLVDELPWIAIKYPNLSDTTIRHLLTAPHMGRKAAKSYKNLVQVRLAKGSNNLDEDFPLVPPLSLSLSVLFSISC